VVGRGAPTGGAKLNLGLEGRTAIVCGASSGMGLAIAERLAAEGVQSRMLPEFYTDAAAGDAVGNVM
jgi:hypothetical protein